MFSLVTSRPHPTFNLLVTPLLDIRQRSEIRIPFQVPTITTLDPMFQERVFSFEGTSLGTALGIWALPNLRIQSSLEVFFLHVSFDSFICRTLPIHPATDFPVLRKRAEMEVADFLEG